MTDIVGTAAGDSLDGGAEADSIDGAGGDDTIRGLGGDDRLEGGDGNDVIYDSNSSNDIASDVDILEGGDGDDRLVSYQGGHFQDHDTLDGGNGNDILELFGTQTNDRVDGGDGFDQFNFWLFSTFQTVVAGFDPAGFEIQLGGINTVFVSNCEQITMSVGSGADQISGGDFNDVIISGGGADTLSGRGGDDTIHIYLSTNFAAQPLVTLSGGTGTDRLIWYVTDGSTAPHVFDIVNGIFTRNGTSLGTITGFERLDVLGSDGNDSLIGGAFSDSFQARGGNDQIAGNAGDDFLNGMSGDDDITGGAGNDRLTGADGADDLDGGGGNDLISGGAGVDTLNGGAGNDTYQLHNADDTGETLIDASGIDTVETSLASFSLVQYANLENLTGFLSAGQSLTGNAKSNIIKAYTGNDTASGGGGNDQLSGNTGNDQLAGDVGNDTLQGEKGDDSLDGGAGGDVLSGGEGNDSLGGGLGNDKLSGDTVSVPTGIGFGSGNLTKNPGAGNTGIATAIDVTNLFSLADNPDIIAPTDVPHVSILGTGDGNRDYYKLTIAAAGVVISLDIDRAGLAGSIDSNIRILNASGLALAANDQSSTSEGAGGSTSSNDSFLTFITTAPGTYYIEIADWPADPLTAGAEYRLHVSVGTPPGNDTLDGGAGKDTIDGGGGNDTGSFASAAGSVIASTTTVTDDGFGNAETMAGIENLIGGDHDDTLTGSNGANLIDGGSGDDDITGGAGNDQLAGGAGNDSIGGGAGKDTVLGGDQDDELDGGDGADKLEGEDGADSLAGSAGADVLLGGAGDDTLEGGAQNDRLTGGAGADLQRGGGGQDIFDFDTIAESGLTNPTMDFLDDFTQGQDKIDLKSIDAMRHTAGNNDFTLLAAGASFSAEGQIRFQNAGANTRVELNTDGTSGAEMAFLVKGNIVFSEGDFAGLV